MNAMFDVVLERFKQLRGKGYDAAHDDAVNPSGELALAAACYAISASRADRQKYIQPPPWWPWALDVYRPRPSRRQDLVTAAALLLAEIDRLDRLGVTTGTPK